MINQVASLQTEFVQRRKTWLPYGRQWIDEADIQAVVAVLQSEYLTTGPQIEHFERKLALRVGASYAVAFSNGTAALHAACYAAGIGPGDEVITTPITFAASANCVLYQQGIPVFADIDEQTYNIDPNQVAALITPRTKAIIPVDYSGQPADLHELRAIAKEHGLVVIEDAAHALGAAYDGQPIGSISDMTMFSLHPVKQITSGEGGVITTNSLAYYEKLLEFRSHGIVRDPVRWSQESAPVGWYYEMQSLGYNYRLTDMQAALASSQLDKLDRFVELRSEYAAYYDEAFSQFSLIKTPFQKESRQSSWHLYVIQLELEFLSTDRNQIYNELIAENIGVQVHYIPVYLHPYYQQLGYAKGQCLKAEKLFERMLTLPLFPSMTHEDVQDVIDAVFRVIGKYAC
ncbi:UDP-4-amino-4,6-dideoxy-N-acetyl-beta-L-altrosamine transaminase [Paenibacillus psychroresistens]|uniref:UDP-4-amino-4, 6-dideoxy-N-acetyl-beta-L-altrosamine transaminase n=1 Tax=Paenibacillus psychroresistens TaxID=1778678 RepID=A0A6B8RDW8_9BACL|nr:UDP-4-amino-4,6-dideoxy-N-acetyl-beta-L-altrosamine transaminase [Paenibacillus psychroresistens]QGQ94360.1 UDP-4-amino-4,6-dideoxy-N-acetyl-beta-L-altrosamine transaminase [Paenibacillus psychroresistens]